MVCKLLIKADELNDCRIVSETSGNEMFIPLGFVIPIICFSNHKEKCYQNYFAKQVNGSAEVLMPDNTRCDIPTEDLAIEVDFAYKWAEAIGQSLHYAKMMNRQAAIIIILKKKR